MPVTLEDQVSLAQFALADEVAALYAEAQQKMNKVVLNAYWRLNELEAFIHYDYFNQFWQYLFYPVGARRNGANCLLEETYLSNLPVEHRGKGGAASRIKNHHYEYPAHAR